MARLDAKCTVEQFNLLEIMLTGRAAMGVIKKLYPPTEPPSRIKATVVVGPLLEGDVHDIGKNVLKSVLAASGYRVVDCGKDCPVIKMIDAVEREAALAVSVSGLITTVIPQVRSLKSKMAERGLEHIRLMAGGAALKQASPESLYVDFEVIAEKSSRLLNAFASRNGFILSSGCEIPPEAKPEDVAAMVFAGKGR